MGKIDTTDFVMVSNRGPNFITPGNNHQAMGGTKGIYPQLMDAFCDSWVCLCSGELDTGTILSDYGDKLDVLFIEPKIYREYYYEYVSEKLYPDLLGYTSLHKTHSRASFDKVMGDIVTRLNQKHSGKDVIICDYHLYSLPKLLPATIAKVFFWFIPILTIDMYDDSVIEILDGLNHATELYFFDDVWAQNFTNLFHHFLPNQKLNVKVKSLMMGPDDFYGQEARSTRADYERLLQHAFGKVPEGRHIISVSRMDFVKRLPLLIEGFESYVQASSDHNTKLLLFAPHHRQDSAVYAQENQRIKDLVNNSPFGSQIFITHEHTESIDLRTIFGHADAFVCPSTHDAMPLTPLEYILANDGKGTLALTNTLGAYRLLSTTVFSFEPDDPESLGKTLKFMLSEPETVRSARMELMKQIVSNSTIQCAIKKLSEKWSQ